MKLGRFPTALRGVAGTLVAVAVLLAACQSAPAPPDGGIVPDDPIVVDDPPAAPSAPTILIVGQSNAAGFGELPATPVVASEAVRSFGNDYVWARASEPLDDPTNQVDLVSLDDPVYYSFGTRLGDELHAVTGLPVYLVPAAKGDSATSDWLPLDDEVCARDTLFGSATFRALVATGHADRCPGSVGDASIYEGESDELTAVIWFQGEADAADPGLWDGYASRTRTIMASFAETLDVPIIYVQLAERADDHTDGALPASRDQRQQVIREQQRLLEAHALVDTGSGPPTPVDRFHMVVAFDLPLRPGDDVHLSRDGLDRLAERLTLAYRQHVLGEDVNGTGPRLVGIEWSSNVVRLRADRALRPLADADIRPYFTVQDASGPLSIVSVALDPGDAQQLMIAVNRSLIGSVRVRYMPPPTGSTRSSTELRHPDAVRDTDGLPLPTFGTVGID